MDPSILGPVAAGAAVLLVSVGVRHSMLARRQGDTATLVISLALVTIGVGAASFALGELVAGSLDPVLRRVAFVLALASCALFHRAANADQPVSRADSLIAGLLVLGAAGCLTLPFPDAAGLPTTGGRILLALVVTVPMLATMGHAAMVVWLRNDELPAYAARRADLLSLGYGGLGIGMSCGVIGYATGTASIQLALAAVVVVSILPAAASFLPPTFVRERLRREPHAHLSAALDALPRGEGRIEDALARVADVLGATQVLLVGADGAVQFHHEVPGEPGPWLDVPLHSGQLRLRLHPLAPLVGQIERDLLQHVARDLDLANLARERMEALQAATAAQQDLSAARRNLRLSNDALTEFGSSIAHDLKAPLAVIRAAAETMLRVGAPDKLSRDLLHRCLQQTDRATELISGQLAAAIDPTATGRVSLEHVVDWVSQTLEDELEQADTTLTWTSPLPLVTGSEPVLRRVLLNLVRNAIQHARTDRPLTVAIVANPALDAVLVIDDGRGIPRDEWDRVFETGQRLPAAGAGGHGLGLGGARAAMQRIGGDLRIVDALDGRGTTFAIELPGAHPARPTPQLEAPDAVAIEVSAD